MDLPALDIIIQECIYFIINTTSKNSKAKSKGEYNKAYSLNHNKANSANQYKAYSLNQNKAYSANQNKTDSENWNKTYSENEYNPCNNFEREIFV